MRVLQVNNHHHIIGGSDQVYFKTRALLEEKGITCHSFAARSDKDLHDADDAFFPEAPPAGKQTLKDLPSYLFNHKAGQAMKRYLDHSDPFDIAHLHIFYGRLTTAILRPLKRRGIGVVQSLHEYKLVCPVYTLERDGFVCTDCISGSTLSALRYRCKRGSLSSSLIALAEFHASRMLGDVRLVDQFICVSAFQKALLVKAGLPTDKLTILHNFVDVSEADLRPVDARQGYILYFGRLERLKGLATLIQAAKIADIPLVVAGSGPFEKEARHMAQGYDIRFAGFQSGDALKKLIAQALAVAVPSEWYENCPMSVLEAKAFGVPVIGARIGGIPELVRDSIDGFLFEPGDVAGLANAFRSIQDVDLPTFAAAARHDALARFSGDQHFRQLTAIYASVRR